VIKITAGGGEREREREREREPGGVGADVRLSTLEKWPSVTADELAPEFHGLI
jgi:hypothetical protein